MIEIKSKKHLEQSLNLLYSIFNKLLFGDTLPKVTVVTCEFKEKGLAGCFLHDAKTLKPLIISIDKRYKDPVRALVHEMAHVEWTCVRKKTGSEHPPGFIRLLNSKYKKLGFEPVHPSEL